MRRNTAFTNKNAVSEVVGALILVLIAVGTFSVIYFYFQAPEADKDICIDLVGDVDDSGLIVLEHKGGSTLDSYIVCVRYINNTLIDCKKITDDNWRIGDYRYPLDLLDISHIKLLNESCMLKVEIYYLYASGESELIFSGTLKGKTKNSGGSDDETPPPANPFYIGDLMLVSSLLTNTTEEDLICYNNTIDSQLTVSSYIFNWVLDNNSITDISYSFDTENLTDVKDYSGNKYNGSINDAIWSQNGKISGAYILDGVDDYISTPYCFDSNYVDEVTVEAWIKTSSNSGVITSYYRNKLWELLVDDGVIRWFTKSNEKLGDTIGHTNIADFNWHHIAATYNFFTGESAIYVDGKMELNETVHSALTLLGPGDYSNGFIGKTESGNLPGTWTTLTYDDFEGNFGNYTDGGRDCKLYSDGTYAHKGDYAVDLQDNNGIYSSLYLTDGIDVHSPGYKSIKLDFWFIASSMEYSDDFWVRYWDGNNWITIADYDVNDDFVNDQFYHEILWINETDYNFPTDMKIRFQCDANSDSDDVLIDEVYINVSTGDKPISKFIGKIDEFRIYNRALSPEQIYQNYLCTKDGDSDISVIVSEETLLGNIWKCFVTPNDKVQDDVEFESNSIQIIGYKGGN